MRSLYVCSKCFRDNFAPSSFYAHKMVMLSLKMCEQGTRRQAQISADAILLRASHLTNPSHKHSHRSMILRMTMSACFSRKCHSFYEHMRIISSALRGLDVGSSRSWHNDEAFWLQAYTPYQTFMLASSIASKT
jgi:hypothetical protein